MGICWRRVGSIYFGFVMIHLDLTDVATGSKLGYANL